MHVSLDSALGRQRRLNSVGESVLQIAPNAAAAYSLRSLTGGDPTVVRVRRSSNNAEQDFTSSEVSSGALTSFVNEIQTLGTVTNSVGNDGFTLTNKSSTGFTATTDTATGVCGWPYTAKAGDKITVSFDAVIRSGTPQFIPRKATALSGSNLVDVVSDSAISVNSTASYSFEFTYDSDEAGSLTFSEGDDNADFDISNFQVTAFKGAGFVETWYDQSGNGKDAVQETAGSQPKIVNSGTLLNELDFDGTNDTFSINFGADLSQASSIFMVHQSDTTTATSNEFFDSSSGANPRTLLDQSGTDYRMFSTGASVGTGVAITTDKSLIFALYNGTSSLFAKNGTPTSALNAGTTDINQNSVLGSSGARFYDGSMQEVIIYNSDQSSNRVALETNINSHYSIF